MKTSINFHSLDQHSIDVETADGSIWIRITDIDGKTSVCFFFELGDFERFAEKVNIVNDVLKSIKE